MWREKGFEPETTGNRKPMAFEAWASPDPKPSNLPLLPELTMRRAAEIPAPVTPIADGGEWNWDDPGDRADVVVDEQPATAIYPNLAGR
jgi:hypothetical protein